MKKKLGSDIPQLKWKLYFGGEEYNWNDLHNLKVVAKQTKRPANIVIPTRSIMTGNELELYFSAADLEQGKYTLQADFAFSDVTAPTGKVKAPIDWVDAFEIVEHTFQEDETGAEFTSELKFGVNGLSAYEAYKKYCIIEGIDYVSETQYLLGPAAAYQAALDVAEYIATHNNSETAHSVQFATKEAAGTAQTKVTEHNSSTEAHSGLFAEKENTGVAAGLITQLIDSATSDGNTLKRLEDRLRAAEAIIGNAAGDDNDIIDTVRELLAVFSNFPEGSDMATLLTAKVNVSDIYNALDCIIEAKTLDARQGKVLNDAITALQTVVAGKADKTYTDTELAKKVDKVEGKGLSTNDYTNEEKTKLSQLKTDNWVGVIVDGSLSCTEPAPKSTVTAYKATELARTGNLQFHKFGQSRIFNAIYPAIVNRATKTIAWVLDKNDFTKKADGSASNPDWTIHNICMVYPTLYRRVTVLNPAVADCKYEIAYDIEPFEGATLFHEESFHGISDAQKDRTLNTLVQVVSDDVRYRGGGNQAAWDAQSWRSQLGMPCTDTSRTNFEAYANAAGWETMNIYDWTMFHELAMLYFANTNIQLAFTTTLTPEGYPQGGLGDGNTTWISKRWSGKNSYYPLDKVGEGSMSVGCNVGVKSKTVSDYYIGVTTSIAANKVIGTAEFSAGNGWLAAYIGYTINNLTTGQSATIVAKDSDDQLSLSADIFTASGQIFQIVGSTFTYSIPVFFGLENLYGHLWKICSGINFMIQAADSGGKSLAYVNPVWATRSAVNVDAYTLIGEIPRADGYIKSLITGWNVPKNTTGGGSTSYMSDYLYQTVPANGVSLRALLVSGTAAYGTTAGLRYALSYNAPSAAAAYIGARLRAKKV